MDLIVARKHNLVCKSFLVAGINNKLNGAKSHMIRPESDIEQIFDDKHDDELLTASQHGISLLLQQI